MLWFPCFSRGSTLVCLAVATAKRERQRCQQQQQMENCNLHIRPNLNTILIYFLHVTSILIFYLYYFLPSFLTYLNTYHSYSCSSTPYSYSDYSYYCHYYCRRQHHHHSYYQLSTTYLTTWLPNHLTTYLLPTT